MFKNILIPVDGSPNGLAAVRYGIWFAKKFKATLTGLNVVDIVALEGPFLHDLSGSLGFEPYLNFSAKMREMLENKGDELLKNFGLQCKDERIKSETVLAFGIITNEIVEKARVSDLVIIGRRGVNYQFESGLLGSIAEGVIRKSPKPILIVPNEFKEISKPLLVYDGSVNASKAMKSAAEISKTLKLSLTVLVVTSKDVAGEKIVSEARDYLSPYRLNVEVVERTGSPPDEILAYYEDNGHDLILTGITSHSRIVEMVLGSTTEFVLRNVDCPVFLER